MVEGNGLENRRAGNGTVGSNPTLSARREGARHKPGFFSTYRDRDLNPVRAKRVGSYRNKRAGVYSDKRIPRE